MSEFQFDAHASTFNLRNAQQLAAAAELVYEELPIVEQQLKGRALASAVDEHAPGRVHAFTVGIEGGEAVLGLCPEDAHPRWRRPACFVPCVSHGGRLLTARLAGRLQEALAVIR